MTAISVAASGYGLDLWAVTGKLNFDSQNIDTWYFGAELTTPIGSLVLGSNATAKDLSGTDKSSAYDYVGSDGEVYQTFVQFVDPDNSSNYESFSCSRVLTVKS